MERPARCPRPTFGHKGWGVILSGDPRLGVVLDSRFAGMNRTKAAEERSVLLLRGSHPAWNP